MPHLMVVVPKKMRAAHHVGSWSFGAIKDFVAGMRAQRERERERENQTDRMTV